MKNVLLYGGGTQSTGLLLMMCDGFIPEYSKPDLVIFSDTMAEPYFVNEYILKVKRYVWVKYRVEIEIISNGNIIDDLLGNKKEGTRAASLPLFLDNGGMIRRQCTNEYKIIPINKVIKERFEIGRKKKESKPVVNRLFGMSLDEIGRCKQSTEWWAENKYLLVYERMYRNEVIRYVNLNHPELADPPRSSCYFCPFHSNLYWKLMKRKHPKMFKSACEIDELIRDNEKLRNRAYLHRSLKPLREINFEQLDVDIFGECEGYCGI